MPDRLNRRRSIRASAWDYDHPGAYFVTICAQRRACLFGRVADCEVRLSRAGEIIRACWEDLPAHYPYVVLDAFIIMPNHVHAVIILTEDDGSGSLVGAGLRPAPTAGFAAKSATPKRHGLPEIVRALKSFSARSINETRGTPGTPVWQRNYYERIIRNERELNAIRAYIANNPYNWPDDPENPLNERS